MTTKTIVIFTASEKKNLELANSFIKKLTELETKVELINILDLELPLFSSRTSEVHTGEELLKEHLPMIREATGMVFLAPEYNGATPPAFGNFLAWLSRTSKDWREFLNGKFAVIGTFSAGGGLGVLTTMRQQLSYLGMNVLGRQIHTNFNKPLDENSVDAVCRELVRLS